MNKMLIAIFDNETAANSGLQALRRLHASGDITLYASGVMAKDPKGAVNIRKAFDDQGPVGTATGLAVGSLIGLLGGPVGLAVGAVAGSMVGAVRDFWAAGVGLDFVEEVERFLQPGKVALVAEVEEEWVIPVDTAMESAGGQVFRRTRSQLAQAQFDQDIEAFKSEIKELEAEASQATGAAKAKLETKLASAKGALDEAVHRSKLRMDALKQEAESKVESLNAQLCQAKDSVKSKLEERAKRVKAVHHERGLKLSKAWTLTKEALAM
jgi:uncharacterized membrane protein